VATPDVTAIQRSDLSEFLFADVGVEANGMTLSVVSVFARQDRDPWGEARRLADLPKSEATDSLARTIAAMPRSLWDLPTAVVIAVCLTSLLPARSKGMAQVISRWPPPHRRCAGLHRVGAWLCHRVDSGSRSIPRSSTAAMLPLSQPMRLRPAITRQKEPTLSGGSAITEAWTAAYPPQQTSEQLPPCLDEPLH
jgi:hypothetical protein